MIVEEIEVSDPQNKNSSVYVHCSWMDANGQKRDKFLLEVLTLISQRELSDHDKWIAVSLIRAIDLDTFKEDFFDQHSWYGYKKETLKGTFTFVDNSTKLSHVPDDVALKNRIAILREAFQRFHDCSGQYLISGSDGWYEHMHRNHLRRFDDPKINKMYEETSQEMNRESTLVQAPFEDYLAFIRQHNLMPLYKKVRAQFLLEEQEAAKG